MGLPRLLTSLLVLAALVDGRRVELRGRSKERKGKEKQQSHEEDGSNERMEAKMPVDPASIGLLAAGTVVYAGWKAFQVYKDRAKWEEKDLTTRCMEQLEQYQKISTMLVRDCVGEETCLFYNPCAGVREAPHTPYSLHLCL